ncbi:hypothetical protein SAMN04488057_10145 [Cyclobacterium lianum]|uniref:DUF4382 domain-containing protein n=1 Tax=Cyclobacterium lianum TaxID=388280 RepID=A0A1M7HSX6_9BACT|nr:hypothetical protein [Cyclobacterium lianum]SHM31565.1 hypothetical protein SAMN04488057_10145 [Cyclobacterium lianum]
MQTTVKKWIGSGLSFGIFLGMISCEMEEDTNPPENQEEVQLQSTARQTGETDPGGRSMVNTMVVSDFQVGTREIEMKYAAEADIVAGIDLGSISLKSNIDTELGADASEPQTLILISEGQSRVSAVGEGSTPKGNYQEIQFELYKNTTVENEDPMYGKSLWISGEINGETSQVWMDTESVISASAENEEGHEVNEGTELMLVFDLDDLFENVDFEAAADANSDGVIEIAPGDLDGNADLYSQIEANLESAVKFESGS